MALLDAQQPEQPVTEQPEPQGKSEETYQRIGLAAMKVIYSKPESDHILEILRAGKDRPAEAVAQAALAVIKRLSNSIQGIEPNLAFSVAPTVVALIFEIGMVAEIFTEDSFQQDADPQKLIGEALAIMAKLERGMSGGQTQGMPQMMPQQQTMGA